VLDGVLGLRRDRERIKILVSEAAVVLLLNPFLFFASRDICPGRVFSFFAPFIDRWDRYISHFREESARGQNGREILPYQDDVA